jgi:hypothetical protein
MTMDEENIESLIRRWQGLDGLLTNCVIAGTKPPTELEQELMQLEGELKSRGVEEPRGPLFTDWLGQKLSGFVIDYLMEEGIYWYLFHGKHPETGAEAAFKLSKLEPEYGVRSAYVRYPTRVIGITNDDIREVTPAPGAIIAVDEMRLNSLIHPALTHVKASTFPPNRPFYRCDFVEGTTLEKIMDDVSAPIGPRVVQAVYDVALALADLCKDKNFAYHGNLRPENILVTPNGIRFLELGYFGPFHTTEGLEMETRLVAPQYYPWLDCDDIAALGIMIWEAFMDFHPFDDQLLANEPCDFISPEVVEMIEVELSLDNPYLRPLRAMRRPRQILGELSLEFEALMLKTLRMRIGTDGMLHEGEGFENFEAFSAELEPFLGLEFP